MILSDMPKLFYQYRSFVHINWWRHKLHHA